MLSVRLSDELQNRLEEAAQLTQRSKSFFVKEALERYLEDLEDFHIALKRLNDPDAELLSTDEARKYLDL